MSVLLTPLLTEKAALKMDKGLYVLRVSPSATKQSITQELKKNFSIDAISVRIVNLPAQKVKFRRVPGVQAERRKAYVQLKSGQKLPGFELPKQKNEKEKPLYKPGVEGEK